MLFLNTTGIWMPRLNFSSTKKQPNPKFTQNGLNLGFYDWSIFKPWFHLFPTTQTQITCVDLIIILCNEGDRDQLDLIRSFKGHFILPTVIETNFPSEGATLYWEKLILLTVNIVLCCSSPVWSVPRFLLRQNTILYHKIYSNLIGSESQPIGRYETKFFRTQFWIWI